MNKSTVLLPATFFIFCIMPAQQKKEEEPIKPNLVFILVDDLGWADVQYNFPESFYETPNIDRMAEEGVRFTQAYSAHPVCSPTRAALMTSNHPNRLGITNFIPGHNIVDRSLLGPKKQRN